MLGPHSFDQNRNRQAKPSDNTIWVRVTTDNSRGDVWSNLGLWPPGATTMFVLDDWGKHLVGPTRARTPSYPLHLLSLSCFRPEYGPRRALAYPKLAEGFHFQEAE